MNFSRSVPARPARASMHPGMLETMVKHLYIRRFPALDSQQMMSPAGETPQRAQTRPPRTKKPATQKKK